MRPGLAAFPFLGVLSVLFFPLPFPLPLPLRLPELPMKLLSMDTKGSTLADMLAKEVTDKWSDWSPLAGTSEK